MIKNIKNVLLKMDIKETNLKDVSLYITKQDEQKYKSKIKECYPKIKINTIDNSYIGGCKCFSKDLNIFIDNTLKLSIEEQVENRRW